MTRFHCLRPVVLALAGLVVFLSVTLPLKAQSLWTKEAHLIYAGNTFTIYPAGSFSPLGSKVTGGGVLPSAETGIGTFTLVPRKRDEIYFAYYFVSISGDMAVAGKAFGYYTVVGGKGRYANASGSGEIRLWRNTVGDPSGMVNDMYLNGDLSY